MLSPQPNVWTSRRILLVSVGIFLVAFVWRVLLAWRFGYFSNIEPDEMVKIGYSLASTGQFANPYLIPTGPTAHTMPLYPLFLAALFKVFGAGLLAEKIKILSASGASALRCALLPRFAIAARLPMRVGVIASLLGAFYITALQTDLRGSWDQPWQALALLSLTWMTIHIWRNQDQRLNPPKIYYLAWGLAVLLSVSLLPILIAFIALGAFACPPAERQRYLRNAGLLLLVVGLTLAPWVWRNYSVFGAPMLRGNLGLELWVSNGPGAAYDTTTNLGDRRPHPSTTLSEAVLVARLGEVAYNRLKLHETWEWVKQNPSQFLTLTVRRTIAWWFPPGGFLLRSIANYTFGLLAFAGLWQLFRVDRLSGSLLFATWLVFPLLYYVIEWSSKYRFPMDWEMFLSASIPLSVLGQWFYHHTRKLALGQ